MSRLWKIVAGIAVVVVAAIVALLVLAKVLITPERVKAVVVPLAEATLQRRVSLGEIEVGLFSGIELHNLAIAGKDGSDQLLTVDVARLRFQLLPLLAKRVIVDEILLERPKVHLSRDRQGMLSIADLLAAAGDDGKPAEKGVGGGAEPSISLVVSEVRVSDGEVVFVDSFPDPAHPVRIELTGLEVQADGFVPDGSLPLQLKGVLNGAPLAVDGTLRLKEKGGRFTVDLQQLDASSFAPYFREKLPGRLDALTIDLKADVDRSAQGLTASGTLTGHGLALHLDALPAAPIANATVRTDFDLTTHPDRDEVEIRRLALDYNGLGLTAAGRLSSLSARPSADLVLTIPGLDLRQATTALPPGLLGKAGELALSGVLRADLKLAGEVAEPLALLRQGSVVLEQVQVTAGGHRPEVNGRLKFAGEQLVTEELSVRLAGNTAQLKWTVRNLFGKPLLATVDVSAQRFLLEPLLQGGGAAVAGKVPTASAEQIGPFDLPLQAGGTIRIGETVWKGLAVRDFFTEYALRDNQLTLSRMSGKVAGGSFTNTMHVDLRRADLAYDATLALQGVQADPLVTALAPQAAGTLFGAMTVQSTLRGSGTSWETISRTLSGDGVLALTDGRLTSPALIQGFAAILQLPGLNEIAFQDFRGTTRIVNGKVELNSILAGRQLKLLPKGALGLDGSLNLALDTRLSPELTARLDQRGKVTRYLLDADGWSQVPLLVTGTLKSPRFGLDPRGVEAQATRALQQELQRGIDKLLRKSQPPPATPPASPQQSPPEQQEPTPPPAPRPGQQLLEESLKRVLGQ